MKFIKGVPNIKISQNDKYIFEINTVQKFNEDEDRIILKCAEEVPEFQRGFVCNMDCIYMVEKIENNNSKIIDERNDTIKDLVLVYINNIQNVDILQNLNMYFINKKENTYENYKNIQNQLSYLRSRSLFI